MRPYQCYGVWMDLDHVLAIEEVKRNDPWPPYFLVTFMFRDDRLTIGLEPRQGRDKTLDIMLDELHDERDKLAKKWGEETK